MTFRNGEDRKFDAEADRARRTDEAPTGRALVRVDAMDAWRERRREDGLFEPNVVCVQRSEIGMEHVDYFVKSLVGVRTEKRLALAVKRPASYVTGAFTASLA